MLSEGRQRPSYLSNSAFTRRIPLFTTSVLVVLSFFAHSSSKSSSSSLMRSCKLLSRLLVPLIGRPVLGDIFSPHFCHGLIIYYAVAKVKRFLKIFLELTKRRGLGIIKTEGTATAVGSLIANLTQLTARGHPGGQHAFGAKYSMIARMTTTQTATRRNCARRLLPIHITSPLSKFAGGSNGEPTAYVTVLLWPS